MDFKIGDKVKNKYSGDQGEVIDVNQSDPSNTGKTMRVRLSTGMTIFVPITVGANPEDFEN